MKTFRHLCWWDKAINDWGRWDGTRWSGALCLPVFPATWNRVAVGGCCYAGGRRRVSLACLSGPCQAGRSSNVLLGGPEGGLHFNYLFRLLLLPLPAYQPLPTHWLAHPEVVAALVMDMLIPARCSSQWLKARDTARNFILGHTLARLLQSPPPHPKRVTIILPRATTHINHYDG